MNVLSFTDLPPESPRRIPLHQSMPGHNRQGITLQKVALPTMEGISIEKVQNIICLEAQGNYTLIHCLEGRQLLVCKTLRDVETMLENNGHFVRVHRSFTINLDRLVKYYKGKGGYVVMENGTKIDVSHTRKQDFIDSLRLHFGYE